MSDIFILDDRPDDDPEVIARREKEWNELPPDVREKIERDSAEAVAYTMAQRKANKKD